MKKHLVLLYSLLYLFFFTYSGNAQQMYGTVKGMVNIEAAVSNGQKLMAKSEELYVKLDYNEAKVNVRLDLSTLRTGVDTLDTKLMSMAPELVLFETALNIHRIETESHPPTQLEFEGWLTWEHQRTMIPGRGVILHISGGEMACVLSIRFIVDLEELGISVDIDGLDSKVQVEIMQTILNRD